MSKQQHEEVPSHWKTLILDYLENTITDQQFLEIRTLIEKPDFQRLLAEYAIDQSILRELTRSEELVEEISKSPWSQKKLGESIPTPSASAAKWGSRNMGLFVALSAMLLVLLTAVFSLRWNSSSSAPASSVQILSMVGKVSIDDRLVQAEKFLKEGSQISTDDVVSFARLSYEDGTTLVLAGSSAIVCTSKNGQKVIQVKRGSLSASVSPQPPGKPLLIVTDTARMEVVGTHLAISANHSSTRLDVTEGNVKIQERTLGSQADVSAGNYAVAKVGENIEVLEQLAIPDTWKLDFENGLPVGWQQGIWEKAPREKGLGKQKGKGEGLPGPSSLGAVRQAFSPENGNYSIISPNAWSEGQFRICENSYLQFRVKMDRPEWYQVLLVTRDEGFRSSDFRGVFEYQESNAVHGSMKHLPPNEWRTVRIPLSSFKRTNPRKYPSVETSFDQRPADPPRVGDVVFTLIFGTQKEDRGLVVDDISVSVDESKL